LNIARVHSKANCLVSGLCRNVDVRRDAE